MGESKFLPVRTCIGCGKKGGKADFIKIVKNKNGEVFVDADKENFGRGSYICRDAKCVAKAEKKNRLSRTLRLSDCAQIYQKLNEIIGD